MNDFELEQETLNKTETQTSKDTETQIETETETETLKETETETETLKETETETGTLKETETKTETETLKETETQIEAEAETETETLKEIETSIGTSQWWKVWENEEFPTAWVAGGVLAVLVAMLGIFTVLRVRGRKGEVGETLLPMPADKGKMSQKQQGMSRHIGKVHNIGSRKDQQDSFGVTEFAGGVFAVVADGMGGLSGGDKISQKVVMTMLSDVSRLDRGAYDQVLFEYVSHANREVNAALGNPGQLTSGSTVVAAIVGQDRFHWVSVGDSRICLYRNGRLIQLNREHTYGAELLIRAVNGAVAFEEARSHPKRGGLTSFIGMGELRYVDGSSRGVQIQQGDRLLLMSDGVFHTLSEEELQQIMEVSTCAEEAASVIQERILAYQKANQDNFTAVIIDL